MSTPGFNAVFVVMELVGGRAGEPPFRPVADEMNTDTSAPGVEGAYREGPFI